MDQISGLLFHEYPGSTKRNTSPRKTRLATSLVTKLAEVSKTERICIYMNKRSIDGAKKEANQERVGLKSGSTETICCGKSRGAVVGRERIVPGMCPRRGILRGRGLAVTIMEGHA